MEKEEIIRHMKTLPVCSPGTFHADSQVWEGFENGAKFTMSHDTLPIKSPTTMFSLTVSGQTDGVERLIRDFIGIMGEPDAQSPTLNGNTYAWLAEGVEQRLSGE
jgi:hypothetical protein